MFTPLLAFLAFAIAEPQPGCAGAPAETVCSPHQSEGFVFVFSYPRVASETPALEALLLAEATAGRTWIEAAAASRGEGAPPYSYEAGWQIDVATPELVATSGAIRHYTGGAHGGLEYRTILIDRRNGRRIALGELFVAETFEHSMFGQRIRGMRAAQDNFCRALTAAVRERRGDPNAIVDCPRIEEQPVTLVCGANGRIGAMRALLHPYVIGSWAEGPYEVEFPIDARMMASMKRRYRVAFGVAGETRARIPARPCR